MKRTHLPLNALRVFDAAARHLSFTRAADELAVTPAAVGQQIRALEEALGVVLFRRLTRNLELTHEAEQALPALQQGFLAFEEAVRVMQAGQSSRVLSIAAPRALVAKWLTARLADYGRQNPDLRFSIAAARQHEILLVDETLSTGDTEFRARSQAKIRELSGAAGTVFVVAHGHAMIREVCNRAIWMDKGVIKMDGETNAVLDAYEADVAEKKAAKEEAAIANPVVATAPFINFLLEDVFIILLLDIYPLIIL